MTVMMALIDKNFKTTKINMLKDKRNHDYNENGN